MPSYKPEESRYLIYSPDERTWKFDRPVVFLGEWCRLYDRKNIWQNMDAILATPYGLNSANKDTDYIEARILENKLFTILYQQLNHYHRTDHDERFWRIILGHWLFRYVNVIFNRVKTIKQCFQLYKISGLTTYANNSYSLATQDSNSAIWAFNDDRWNSALIMRILNLLDIKNLQIEHAIDCNQPCFYFNPFSKKHSFKKKILKWVYKQTGKLTKFLVKNNDALIVNSYLPKKEEIKLQLSLLQFPQLWISPKLEKSKKPDRLLRERLAHNVSSKSSNELEEVMRIMLFELLPVCYLEGFTYLNHLMKKQPWPKYPKFIFTSNNFDTDEVFKLWVATKVKSGYKYFTGQHGNHYGTYKYESPHIEDITADKFLTWGWTEVPSKHIPAFIFKLAGRKTGNFNSQGNLLLIEDMYHFRMDTWDRCAEHTSYFSDQVKFTQILSKDPLNKLIIRLHSSFKYNNPYEKEIWNGINPAIIIDTGDSNIRDLIANSRLVVHSYDSTGLLETLSENIPTLAFWRDGLNHLRASAKPFYQSLVDAGIIHFTAESVAEKVNEIWDNVDGWWKQSKVQVARERFCDKYARLSQNPVNELKNLLLS